MIFTEKKIECVQCGRAFIYSEQKQRSYAEKGYSQPKHCPECKKKNRETRDDPYFGIQEAFQNNVAVRKRRCRVHYSPYIVGGFR